MTSRRLSGIARITTRHSVARAIIASGLLALVGLVVIGTLPTPAAIAATGINKQINFQGKVVNTNGTNVANGSYSFVFSIYTVASGGSNIWTETKTLTVTDGVFQTNLGSTTSLPGSVDFNTDNIYLGINFNSDGEMAPRIQFTAAAYAFNAENANKLGGIASSGFVQLSPGSTQTGNISVSGTINGATISGGTLSGSNLSASSLTFSAASAASIQAASNQNLTLSTVSSGTLALASAGAVNITGAANSTFDVGAGNTLSLQTTNNGPITTGSGLLTLGGNFTFSGTSARTITGPTTGGLTITDASGDLTLSTTTSGNIAVNSAGTIALSGTNFSLTSAGVMTLAGNQTADITTTSTGTATPITIQPGSSSTNSGTGANLVLKAGNETGTGSTGGSITINAGTGTTNGNVNVGTSNTAVTTVGNSTGTTTINGNASTSITATNGANSTTLNFANPTSGGALAVTVPANVGGTLCTTTTCATGTTGSYIQNGTSQQASSNFNISGTGIAAVALQAPVLSSVDTSTASTDSANVIFRSGNATGSTSNSGTVTLDAGSATGTAGTVSIGNTYSTGTTVGRTGAQLTLQGNQTTTLSATNGANSTTLAFANPTSGGGTTITLPFGVGGTVCTTTASTCNTVYQPYSASGYLAKDANDTSTATYVGNLYNFTNQSTGASGVLALNGYGTNSTLSVATTGAVTLTAGQAVILANAATGLSGNLLDLQVNSVSKFKVNEVGDVTSASAVYNGQTISSTANFTGTVTSANTVSITSGGLSVTAGGISVTAGGLALNNTGITNAGAVSGATTIAASSTTTLSGTGANELAVTGAPAVSATSSLVQLGGTIASGNATAGTGGTYIGINQPSSGAGSTADYLNFQNNGVSKLKVTSAGLLDAATGFAVGGVSGTTVTTCGVNEYLASFTSSGGITTGGTCTTLPSASAGANQQLSNLSGTVAINLSLLTGSSTIDLGSNTNPFRDLYLGGTATNNFKFTGTASAARTLTIDDLSGRLAMVQSTAGTAQVGYLNVSGSVLAPTVDSASAVAFNLGTGNASSISIGKTTTTATINGTLQIGASAGTGTLVNNGNTINTVCAYTGVTGAYTLNTAGKTPDTCTAFTLTTSGAATVTVPAPTAGAGSIVYVSNMSASTNAITLLGANLAIGSTATLVYNGTVWTYAGADSSGLQVAYNNSATTDPQIQLSNTNGGLKLRDASSSSITNLLQIADSAGTTNYLTVTAAAATVGGNILMTTNNSAIARTIAVNDQTNPATNGSQLTVKAAAGNTSGTGGNLVLVAGAGGNASVGGIASLTGGAAGGGNTNGGAATIQGGAAAGTGTGGAVTITGGLAATTAGSLGGTITITGGAGTSTGTGAAGSAVSISGGAAGGSGNNAGGATTVQGGQATGTAAGGLLTLQGGLAAATAGSKGGSVSVLGRAGSSTGTGGVGGDITITAGAAAGSGANAGGNVTIAAGAASSTGIPGVVSISTPVFTSVSETFTQTSNNQVFTSITDPTLQTNLDSSGTIVMNVAGAFTGATVTMPSPTNTAAGRVVYVSAASGSVAFTLAASGMSSVNMSAGNTATLVWNGTGWSGTTTASSLQQVYNNTSTSPASIITTSVTKNLLLQAGVGYDNANVFQVGNSSAAPVLAVDTTNTANGLNLASNGGVETGGTSGWTAFTGTGSASISQNVTASNLAAGIGSVDVSITGTGTGGANNALSSTALASSQLYAVSFNIKASSGTPTIAVQYYKDSTPTLDSTCSVPTNGTVNSTSFFKYTCYFTTSASGQTTGNFLRISKTDASTIAHIYIDNLAIVAQNITGTKNTADLRVGGPLSQGLTLLTLDTFAAVPFTGAVNQDLYGSMYYDTTLGRIQCYEIDGWGSCGAAPDSNLILEPEYAGAVLNQGLGGDTHIGTMTANICSGSGRMSIQPTEGTICASTEEYNFYRWTTSQVSAQTYSIFIKYQLPPTFGGFIDNNTIKMVGRVSSTTDASIAYAVFQNDGTECGGNPAGTTTVTTTANTWQTVSYNGNEATTCTFSPNDIVTFRVDMSSKNNAYAYASQITFTMKGK